MGEFAKRLKAHKGWVALLASVGISLFPSADIFLASIPLETLHLGPDGYWVGGFTWMPPTLVKASATLFSLAALTVVINSSGLLYRMRWWLNPLFVFALFLGGVSAYYFFEMYNRSQADFVRWARLAVADGGKLPNLAESGDRTFHEMWITFFYAMVFALWTTGFSLFSTAKYVSDEKGTQLNS